MVVVGNLVGGFNPFEKILVKLDHFHKFRVENKTCLSCHHLGMQYIHYSYQLNQPAQAMEKNISIQPNQRAELQYFEESSPLICVDRTPHDPPGCSVGETSCQTQKENLIYIYLLFLEGPSKTYVPAAAKQRGCLPIAFIFYSQSLKSMHKVWWTHDEPTCARENTTPWWTSNTDATWCFGKW